MVGKLVIAVLVVVSILAVDGQRDYIPAFPTHGMEIIFSNDTSYLNQLDWFRGGLYVSGSGAIFQVNEWPSFNISYFPFFNAFHRFLDFKTFDDHQGYPWAVGSIANQVARNRSHEEEYPGMNYPLALSGSAGRGYVEIVEPPPGFYMMSAVAVDNSTTNHHIAYFVGWHQHNNASEGVNLTLIRTIVNITRALAEPPIFPVFQYDHLGGDRVYLHNEDFQAYTPTFKPWLFHSVMHYHLIIVDPVTNSVFRVFTPLNTSEALWFNETSGRVRIGWEFGQVTGATYDQPTGHLYLGIAGLGTRPGHIIVIDTVNMTHVRNYSLGMYESNPKALTLDAYGPGSNATHLYVGLFGTYSLLKINLHTWHVTIATLPLWLQSVFGVSVGGVPAHHVYFITNEQQAKVGRIAVENFCEFPCDAIYGFCNASRCECPPGFHVLPDRRCEFIEPTRAPTPHPTSAPTPYPTASPPTAAPTSAPVPSPTAKPTTAPADEKVIKQEKGGEVALGILFAITFVLAATGWYLLYKARGGRGAYEVLESKGLINRK